MMIAFTPIYRGPLLVCSLVLAFASVSYKGGSDGALTLNVEVLHAYDDAPLNEMDLELEQRILQNGVLNGNYQWIGSATSDETGLASFQFERFNALDYQLNLLEADWFQRSEQINPDDFIETNEVSIVIHATPKGTVRIQLINAAPNDENDQISFRLLNSPGEYPTCSNDWDSYTGLNVNVERTCDIEADRYLPFRYTVFKNGETLETVDSIWVARGILTELVIPW